MCLLAVLPAMVKNEMVTLVHQLLLLLMSQAALQLVWQLLSEFTKAKGCEEQPVPPTPFSHISYYVCNILGDTKVENPDY